MLLMSTLRTLTTLTYCFSSTNQQFNYCVTISRGLTDFHKGNNNDVPDGNNPDVPEGIKHDIPLGKQLMRFSEGSNIAVL